MNGLFITFEGIEGSGKTTQIERLARWLMDLGHEVLVTREPGGTPIAESIRSLLLDPANAAMAPTTELLLYAAARAQHVSERIGPALEAGVMVLCDRFSDSTLAYQGYGRGLPMNAMNALNAIATNSVQPHVTFVFDLPVELGLQRALHDRPADRIEQESLDFHERVRDGFLQIADDNPDRVELIHAEQPKDAVAMHVIERIQQVLTERELAE